MSLHLLPVPRQCTWRHGSFTVSAATPILCRGPEEAVAVPAACLAESLRPVLGTEPAVAPSGDRSAAGSISLAIDTRHEGEAYGLSIAPEGIAVAAGNGRGLLHGVRTLEQVIAQAGAILPCCDIQDAPVFGVRGFYHDISRGKMPTFETLKGLIETASRFKLNHFQFYVEHVFPFERHPAVWRGFDVITPDDIRRLDAFAVSLHIEFVPSLALFGHMYEILQNPVYAHLCELENYDPSGMTIWRNRLLHHTIDVSNEASYEVLSDLMEEYLPLFSADTVNVCCDETVDLGMGRNRARAEREGIGELYIGHILRLHEMVARKGRRMMIWGDILLDYPELISRLPGDITFLNWGYSPEETDEHTRLYAERTEHFINCPGTQGWNRLANDQAGARENIRRMVRYGLAHGAAGILNTDWGDYGHINPLGGSIPGLVYSAAASWNPSVPEDIAFEQGVSVLALGDRTETAGGLLTELGALHTDWRMWLRRGIVGLTAADIRTIGRTPAITCRRAPELARTFADLGATVPPEHRAAYEEFAWSARAAALNARTALLGVRWRNGALGRGNAAELRSFAADIRALSVDTGRIWRLRNKDAELVRIQNVFDRIAVEAESIARGGRPEPYGLL